MSLFRNRCFPSKKMVTEYNQDKGNEKDTKEEYNYNGDMKIYVM